MHPSWMIAGSSSEKHRSYLREERTVSGTGAKVHNSGYTKNVFALNMCVRKVLFHLLPDGCSSLSSTFSLPQQKQWPTGREHGRFDIESSIENQDETSTSAV
jgi:hypothetical protein